MNHIVKIVMVTAVTFFIGTVSATFAENVSKDNITLGKRNSCLHQRGMSKFRGGMGMFPAGKALSEEQMKELEAERTEFRNATQDLHQELRSKMLALRSELAKKEPDAKTAMALQKEISTLNAELGQKRIEHLLEMKKIAPYGRMGQLGDGRERLRGGRFRQM